VADLAGPAAVAVLTNGQLVTAGTITSSASPSGTATGFGLTEFFPTGSPAFLFGSHGGTVTPFPTFGSAAAFSMAIQSNGSIVAAGTASAQNSVFVLARYLSNGQLDNSFGTGGRVTTSFGNNNASITAIVLQSDGKIVAVGTAGGNLVVARYLGH
jgi:uncharacterized delta-60 repeat protein